VQLEKQIREMYVCMLDTEISIAKVENKKTSGDDELE
jgi:hypothetical protein